MPPFLPRKRAFSDDESSAKPLPKKPKTKPERVFSVSRKPTLFEDLDTGIEKKIPLDHRSANLEHITETCDEESSLSSVPDEPKVKTIKNGEQNDAESDTDEDIEFEDVETIVPLKSSSFPPIGDLELTLTRDTRISVSNPLNSKKVPSKIERQIRISTHKCHVQTLMWHNAIRNSWLCDKELHKILLKQLPSKVSQRVEKWRQETKALEHSPTNSTGKVKSSGAKKAQLRKQGDQTHSSEKLHETQDPLYRLLKALVSYWHQTFKVTAPGLRKIGYMPLQRLDEILKSYNNDQHDPNIHGERFLNLEHYKECAKTMQGSRDFGAQIFTALLRAIGLKVRMVSSLQPAGFGWSQAEEASDKDHPAVNKVKNLLSATDSDSSSEDSSDNQNLRKRRKATKKSASRSLSSKASSKSKLKAKRGKNASSCTSSSQIDSETSSLSSAPSETESVVDKTTTKNRSLPSRYFDKDLKHPQYWSEVLSPITNTYIPVDAIVNQIVASNKELLVWFEPSYTKFKSTPQVIAYIIGYLSDGSAKDVTTRYLKGHMWPGKTKPYRYPPEKIVVRDRNGKIKNTYHRDWFKDLMLLYERGSEKFPRQKIDDIEEATDLKPVRREKKEVEEGKETLQYYKTSPKFVLQRHLRREEALIPTAKHIKMFTVGKGDNTTQEKVFLRKDVVICKSAETWHKEGRAPRPNEQPLKRVPYRAATTNRKRELAEAEYASGEKMLQGLYSQAQTDWIIPPPIKDGIIPKNTFGNIDLYVESMLPKGAVHIPYRGIPKICKRLGIDFAEAVTGFEFGRRMALPIITGVVVAENYEDAIMEEWHKDEDERVRKEDEKRKQAALRVWRKLLLGLRVLKRFKENYGDVNEGNDADTANPFTSKNRKIPQFREPDDKKMIHTNRAIMSAIHSSNGSDVDESEACFRSGFFPVVKDNEPDDEDDQGGGFIIEDNEDNDKHKQGPGLSSMSMKLDSSKFEAKLSDTVTLDQDEENNKDVALSSRTQKKTGRTSKKARILQPDEGIENHQNETKALPSKKRGNSTATSKRAKTAEDKKTIPTSSDTQRVIPKRNAPRRVKTALKSSYFEHSENDDNGKI
ncbi:hypothetical protein K3495_g10061 [Podosphaera aphanis]|nr:hypothetical protein K3495_g10061 [Podosphaera aphanis]